MAQVVSLPSWELFNAQSQDYKDSVLPPAVKARVGVEAAVKFGWDQWIGDNGKFIGMPGFGASAPFKDCFEGFGITTENIVKAAKETLK